MHGYHWDRKVLTDLVAGFTAGQCQYHSPYGEVFRGPFKWVSVAEDKTVTIEFEWLCRRVQIIDPEKNEILDYRWVMPKFASGPHTISFVDIWYYYQDDEDRLKIVGGSEMCRLYLPCDCTNVVESEVKRFIYPRKSYKRYLPFFRTPQAHFFRVAFLHFLLKR